MRLKAIKLAGFKSFVDPTYIPFPSNLSCIVGPNGCGKSNTIDAVRWVMGESSAKNLRGESMTDVIFNGSNARKPVGQCTVELIFDNTDGKLRGEYASFTEISIQRKVTRDAQNTYYLNGTKCRRKDITDIFLGTGLGPRSYAIIEQGMISRLIESKPEELRIFIEEAAGISKYKERRRDTENRMRRTRENLERLTDIREELGRQLSHLHRQAQAAEKYTEYKKQERQEKAQLNAMRWQSLNVQAQQENAQIAQFEAQIEEQRLGQSNVDLKIEEFRESNYEVTESFNQLQAKFYEAGQEIVLFEQNMKFKQERAGKLGQDMAEVDRDMAQVNRDLQQDKDALEQLIEQLEMLEPEVEMAIEEEMMASEAIAESEENMNQWQQAWELYNSGAAGPQKQAEVAQSRIQHLERVIEQINRRLSTLHSEKSTLVTGPEAELIQELLEKSEESQEQQEQCALQLEGLNEDLQTTKETVEKNRTKLQTKRSEEQQAKGRKATLEALQKAAKDEQSGEVAKWLESQQLNNLPRLAQSIQVQNGWDKAVEVVLGQYLQAVCVNDIHAGLTESLLQLSEGKLVLTTHSTNPNQSNSLASQVTSSFALGKDLTQVLIADNIEQALSLKASLQPGQSVITKEGIWLSKDWFRVSKDSDSSAGILSRESELENLECVLDELDAEIEELEVDLETAILRQRSQEQEKETTQRELNELSRHFSQISAELSGKQVQVEQVKKRSVQVNEEIEEQELQLEHEREQISDSRIELQEALDAMEGGVEERENLLAKKDDVKMSLDEARDRERDCKMKAQTLTVEKNKVQTQIESKEHAKQRLQEQVERLNERKEQILMSMEESDDPLDEMRLELEEKLERQQEIEEKVNQARGQMTQIDAQMRELEMSRGDFERKALALRNDLEQVRMSAQTIITRRQTLQEQLAEQNFNIDAVLETLPEDANEDQWQQSLQEIGNKIQRLGAINLAAIDEYKAQAERKHYLDAQNEDLEKAIEVLENAIRKIDTETRNRFKETYDKVNAGLQELFPKVFGGGHAYLELTGDDLLDTGVAIMARPPGKRNSTIHLLSGGEKALTAIALVFSIFKLNPAPFCMLDEVDAPLDDANVGRYARLVEAMSDHVQFIYITHNKIAMEMGHQLMGVTMNEPGVSRLVSVNVEEAAKLAAL
ncbi:chromosome segregation protein SMC [Marinicellulosiphila megalodicopiae]|uniref:chromosome segregation protein SMC n=1 Tax=Marinicellulosiphila megalodicopiae TaxID=2724896 RepID=UPI003BAE726E